MLGVQDIYALRHKVFVEGKSQRRVAREMGLARDTVRRYLATPLPEPRKRRRSRPVLEQVRTRLEQLLEEWSQRSTAKQRITGRRLQRALREEGYEVGITLVLEYLREWRRRRAEVYVPLVHRPGESAQADFFEVSVELAGERRKAWLFLMRLMHSGRDFVRLYERQGQLAFLDGHVRAFAHFGGVPRRTVYVFAGCLGQSRMTVLRRERAPSRIAGWRREAPLPQVVVAHSPKRGPAHPSFSVPEALLSPFRAGVVLLSVSSVFACPPAQAAARSSACVRSTAHITPISSRATAVTATWTGFPF